MTHSRLTIIFCLLACSLCVPSAAAQTPLRINEPSARATVEAGRVVVSLPVSNASASDVSARLKLELLDTLNQAQAVIERDETIKPGTATITVPLGISGPLAVTLASATENFFWYRLRYQLTPGPTGIIALSEIAPDLFDIHLIYPTIAGDGDHYRARLRAAHPLTGRPAAGVRVACTMEIGSDNEKTLKASAITDGDGFAFCEFDLPRHLKSDHANISARGERNGLAVEARGYFAIDAHPRINVSTDKPIYQPGQTLHLRAVVFDPTMHAARGGALAVKITDPEDTIIYRAVANTSRFGVASIDWPATRDPWQQPYRAEFEVERDQQVLRLRSAGPDKRFDTGDDFVAADMRWRYFAALGKVIDRVLGDYHRRTGGFIRDRETLRAELLPAGTDVNALTDRWGQPYEYCFGVSSQYYTLQIVSGGPARRVGQARRGSDEFTVWTTKQEYFDERRAQVGAALAAYFKAHDRFPQDDAEMNRALAESNIARADLRDGWGRSLYATFKSASQFGNRVRLYTFAQYGEPARQKTEVTPVTQFIKYITLHSAGKDGKEGTADDFQIADYSRVVAEQAANEPEPKVTHQTIVNTGEAGAIAGQVFDPQGAVIPGAKIKATLSATQQSYETTTNDEGRFMLRNLPPGVYEVRFESQGFTLTTFSEVPVQSLIVTDISVTLMVGTTAETVNVMASSEPVQTESTDAKVTTNGRRAAQVTPRAGAAMRQAGVLSTPRLREYFPETLVWQPSIETDKQGRASLRFKLADNITTWRLAVVASTLDGQVSTAETDVLAFQPFFVEHDPPRVLTTGDEISLPVVVRNYLNRKQAVALELSPAAWFRLLGPSRQRAQVEAGDAARVTFDFRATTPVSEAPQRVTATSKEAGDAIEKRVTVHPDGEEMTATTSQVFGESTALTMNIPDIAIAGTARGELKIYPNLSAHVLEAIEAIMQRPYGCAEQTISSAYPSLLALRLYQPQDDKVPPLTQRARQYVQAGYERLLRYREEAGGFSYWGRGNADVALTAYALQFLNDAARFISVDEDVVEAARDWLIKQQTADGSWPVSSFHTTDERTRTAMLTAFVTRALARATDKAASQENANKQAPSRAAHLDRALDYLSRRAAEIDEPYLIAAYALAAAQAQQRERAEQATARLRALVHKERGAAYWSLEVNTPFYGWGRAGRIEATALAVQALASADAINTQTQRHRDTELIDQGLLFLLREKDRYGVWYSTQATVQALSALSAALSEREAHATDAPDTAEVIVNGKRAATLTLPRRDEIASPLTVDVSKYLSAGGNRVEIRRTASASQASAQLVTSHYEPWDNATRAIESNQPLRLKVTYDKTELKAGDDVTCRIEAERIGFHGYGMMLAEIGLPPGADVDRASLDRAMNETGWDVSQYDVLPDHVILYLWPKAGGTRFSFKFKPRYGLKAQTAPSVLYDYYNPDARVTITPTRFVVR
ncbi:MAG: carboxypeptidase regulatory-like domain-containing protein [Blastocatellia bacterium]